MLAFPDYYVHVDIDTIIMGKPPAAIVLVIMLELS